MATTLVVVDDARIRVPTLGALAAEPDLHVIEEPDAARAIDAIGRGGIDAVVCELDLPGAGGLAVLDRARSLGDDAPAFVMLSGAGDAGALSEALRQGAADQLRTPFDPAELRARVAAALRLRDERRRMLRNERLLMHRRDRLAASEIRHRSIVETAISGIVTIDERGVIEDVNPALEAMFGYAREELVGRNVSMLMPEPDRSRHDGYLRRYIAGGEARIIGRGRQAVGRRRDGTSVHVHLSVGEMTVDGRRMFTGLLSDVTDRVRAEQELRRQHTYVRQLLNSVQDGIIVVGPGERVLDVNERLCEMTGFTRDEVLAAGMPRPWWDPAEREAITEQWRRACLAGGAEFDASYVHRSGQAFPVIVGVSVLPDGDGLAAAHIAIVKDVTERQRQNRRLARMADEQTALRRAAEGVATGTRLEEVFRVVAAEIADLMGARGVTVWRIDGERADPLAGHPPDGHRSPGAPPPAAVDRAARTGAPVREVAGGAIDIAWPLRNDGAVWGCLDVRGAAAAEADASPDADETLRRFAALTELAVTNSEARRVLAERAAKDHLTGLLNHRSFHERLRAEWERAVRHRRSLALVVLDIDHFKRVNDTFGHPTGDRVLAEFAERLRACGRAGDVLARVGGEEFAWVLPETGAADAVAMAERCRRVVAAAPFAEVGAITASLGVCADEDASGPGEMYRLADEALYRAKASGRNRVVRHAPREDDGPQPGAGPLPPAAHPSVGGILALARAVDAKDPSTRRHSGRVADLAVRLATALEWSPERCVLLRDAALVHDVGKIAVPDAILLSAERLTDGDHAILRAHSAIGAEIAAEVLTAEQASWVRHHHERHDGAGYPDGLAGGAIPDGARILALADAFDLMVDRGRHPSGRALQDALRECRDGAGSRFDPAVVDALVRLAEVGALLPEDRPPTGGPAPRPVG